MARGDFLKQLAADDCHGAIHRTRLGTIGERTADGELARELPSRAARQPGRHPDGAAHDARRRHRALPRSVSGDGRRSIRVFTYSHAYGGDVRKPLAWLATDHGVPVIDQRTRKLPQRLGQAARPVLQGHDAAPSQGRRHLRLPRPRPVRRDDQAAPGAQDEGLSAHPGGGRARHRELLEGRDRERLRQTDRRRMLEPSGVQGVLERHRRGSVPQLRPRRIPMGRGAREPAHERHSERQREQRVVLLRVLPRARQGARHRRRARAQGIRGRAALRAGNASGHAQTRRRRRRRHFSES